MLQLQIQVQVWKWLKVDLQHLASPLVHLRNWPQNVWHKRYATKSSGCSAAGSCGSLVAPLLLARHPAAAKATARLLTTPRTTHRRFTIALCSHLNRCVWSARGCCANRRRLYGQSMSLRLAPSSPSSTTPSCGSILIRCSAGLLPRRVCPTEWMQNIICIRISSQAICPNNKEDGSAVYTAKYIKTNIFWYMWIIICGNRVTYWITCDWLLVEFIYE